MFGLQMLDLLIGLVTVYLVFGLACTAIIEAIAAWSHVRSNNLKAALNELFQGSLDKDQPDRKFVDAFCNHPLVQSLSKGKDGLPSYIPSKTVIQVVESILGSVDDSSLRAAVDALPDSRVKGLLDTLLKQAGEDLIQFREALETHFNFVMDRASGWVKRRQQTVGLIVAAVLVLAANLDTLKLATSLATHPEAQAALVKTAADLLKEAAADEKERDPNITQDQLKTALEKSEAAQDAYLAATSIVQSAGLEFGWKGWWASRPTPGEMLAKAAGLLISIFAVSLGAPFWFDLLQRFMHLRATGPREVTDENKKK